MTRSVPTPGRRRLSPDDRRAQLLDVAIACFAELGIERAGHGDVAKRAKVSTATVFNYFPTRQDLTLAVLDEIEKHIRAMFENLSRQDIVPSVRVWEMAKAYDSMIDEKPDLTRTFLNWSVSFNPDIRPQYLECQARILKLIQSMLPNGADTIADARMVYGAANMFAIMRFDNFSAEDLQAYIARIARAIVPNLK